MIMNRKIEQFFLQSEATFSSIVSLLFNHFIQIKPEKMFIVSVADTKKENLL